MLYLNQINAVTNKILPNSLIKKLMTLKRFSYQLQKREYFGTLYEKFKQTLLSGALFQVT